MKRRKKNGVTRPYMPRIMDGIAAGKSAEAMELLGDAAHDYFDRINPATETIPGMDAAILIKLFRHMADEYERADPQAAKIVKAMERIKLPPIEYKAKS